mmetsp:Transcript_65583/g.143844  ORF Transcript_65583/g.143844 Transcript_65583/m.143844 type:complete len:104 (+) Transcript_65583:499-810(+)
MMAKLMPQVSACTKDRDEDVLMDAKPLKSPASSTGQHQLPTNAGMENSKVPIATQVDQRSSACVVIASLLSMFSASGGGPQLPVVHSSAILDGQAGNFVWTEV